MYAGRLNRRSVPWKVKDCNCCKVCGNLPLAHSSHAKAWAHVGLVTIMTIYIVSQIENSMLVVVWTPDAIQIIGECALGSR